MKLLPIEASGTATHRRRRTAAALSTILLLSTSAGSQTIEEHAVDVPEQAVTVEPIARDEAIQGRINRILEATGWYRGVEVVADEGVVFLDGIASSEEQRVWARDLSVRTEGVVAVVNRIEVQEEVNWSIAPALSETEALARSIAVTLPLIVLAVLILPLAWWLSNTIASLMRRILAPRIEHEFLRGVIARTIAIPVLLVGVYLVLQVAGLTGLAVSILGGAGVVGIVLGFAFRDIAENFLASLILSIRRPFRQGDLIGVAAHEGVVQTMNTRSTILLTIDGNHVQIPNATVFKSTIVNYTAAPARRVTAEVGIGYDASIGRTQTLIAEVLREHDAILDEPPPMVLVDVRGSATVNLKAHFWIDGRTISPQRIRSSALRLMKRSLVEHGVSMPDEAREIIFPQGVPLVRMNSDGTEPDKMSVALTASAAGGPPPSAAEPNLEATSAEGGLGNEMTELPQNASEGTIPEASSGNLLLNR